MIFITMRVLYLVPYTPTLIRTRPYNLLRHLAQRGHRITLATLWSDAAERQALDQLVGEGIEILAAPFSKAGALANCISAIPGDIPFQSVYSWNSGLAQEVLEKLTGAGEPFDAIHVEHLRGARYGLWLKQQLAGAHRAIPIVWDSVDCISHLFKQAAHHSASAFGRIASRIELRRTERYEPWLVEQFDRTLVTSEQDKKELEQLTNAEGRRTEDRQEPASSVARHSSSVGSGIEILRNGVDLDYFHPLQLDRAKQTLVLSGKMSYHANVTAARYLLEEIMPHVWREAPEAHVEIVGANPTRQVMDLAGRHGERVSVTGEVADLRPHLARAALAVAPIVYGAGVQNKVLEAMAMATPVVATPQAVSALAVQDGEEVLIGGNASDFAEQVTRLLGNRLLRRSLAECGREYVETRHDWRRAAEQLENVYLALVEKRRAQVQGGMTV